MNLHGMNRSAEPKNLHHTLMMKVVQPKTRWKVCVCVCGENIVQGHEFSGDGYVGCPVRLVSNA